MARNRVQLESKNKRYFSIAILHVDSEKKNTRNVGFYFRGGFWAGFGIRPHHGWPVSRMWNKTNTSHIFFRNLHEKRLQECIIYFRIRVGRLALRPIAIHVKIMTQCIIDSKCKQVQIDDGKDTFNMNL